VVASHRKRLRTPTKGVGFVKYWEIIADRLSKAGWSLGWVSAVVEILTIRVTGSAASFSVGPVFQLQTEPSPWDMSLSVPLRPKKLVFVAASKSFPFSAPTGVSEKFC
jgi:hypothetical protein